MKTTKLHLLILFLSISFITSAQLQTSIYVKGTGLNYNGNRVVKLGSNTIVNGGGRGLTLTIINASTHQHISSTNYDTYGNSLHSNDLAAALNSLNRGQIGILTSYDAWEESVTQDLKTAARRLGLYKLGGGLESWSRRPYAAIFRGSGSSTPGHIAYEVMQSNNGSAERAIIATLLIDDAFIGQNLTNALVTGDANQSDPSVFVDHFANVGIGTYTPSEKLSVNGTIRSKEVKVESTGWADYVFEETYVLPTLQEVENHIEEYGHLQDIPSAQEVEEEGIQLGEMNAKLLQKIEELTLYLIEQNKQNQDQQAQIKELMQQNESFKQELSQLKKH